ncbi:MAG: sugar phosphate isomerase/epimerase family protein [Candidatus Thorarchaeota archaeon]
MFVSCSVLGGIRSASSNEKLLQGLIHTLVRIKDAGYENVEVWIDDRPDWLRKTFQHAIEDYGFNAYSIHLPKFLVAFDDEDFRKSTDVVFPFIEALGVKVAVFHPPDLEMIKEGDAWKDRLDRLLDLAEESCCTLTIENVPYLPRVDQFILDLIANNGGRPMGVTIDLEFMHINGSDINQIVENYKDLIMNVHFRDSDGSLVDENHNRKYLVPGCGEINLLRTVQTLHAGGYDKALTVEVSHRNPSNIIEAKIYADSCLNRIK